MSRKKYLKDLERQKIADTLCSAHATGLPDDFDELLKKVIRKIEYWVPHVRDENLRCRQIEAPADFKKEYRQLSEHVDKILWVMEHDCYKKAIGNNPRGLRTGLETLKWLVQGDPTVGRGRKKTTPSKRHHQLVQVLAELFHEISQAKPTTRDKEAHDPEDEAEPPKVSTPFEEFVRACIDPYRVKLTQHEIKQGKKLFDETLSK